MVLLEALGILSMGFAARRGRQRIDLLFCEQPLSRCREPLGSILRVGPKSRRLTSVFSGCSAMVRSNVESER